MRIIAGRFKGHPLTTPKGANTRPTSDKVKESLFASLDSLGMLKDAQVLDVYAGSGALGLEALSRGASRAVFIEKANSAAQVIRTNIANLKVEGQTRVVTAAAAAGARALEGESFDLILADPPYPLTESEVTAALEVMAPRLRDDSSLLVVERSARSPQPELPAGLQFYEHRTYGETALWFVEREPEGTCDLDRVDSMDA